VNLSKKIPFKNSINGMKNGKLNHAKIGNSRINYRLKSRVFVWLFLSERVAKIGNNLANCMLKYHVNRRLKSSVFYKVIVA
jgi:hypothetical protein